MSEIMNEEINLGDDWDALKKTEAEKKPPPPPLTMGEKIVRIHLAVLAFWQLETLYGDKVHINLKTTPPRASGDLWVVELEAYAMGSTARAVTHEKAIDVLHEEVGKRLEGHIGAFKREIEKKQKEIEVAQKGVQEVSTKMDRYQAVLDLLTK